MQTATVPSVPVPGTPAYWTAQREAVALLRAWEEGRDDPDQALRVLGQAAAHGRARALFAARGHDVDRLLRSCEEYLAGWDADDADDEDLADTDPDAPPLGQDWCRRGCQPLFGMECGMCGHPGPGVWADAVGTVAEYCCHCRARTYQSRDGTCELCGRAAEGDDDPPPASPPAAGLRRPGCADTGVACGLLAYLAGATTSGAGLPPAPRRTLAVAEAP